LLIKINVEFSSLDYSRIDMRGAAGEAADPTYPCIYREPDGTKQIGSPGVGWVGG